MPTKIVDDKDNKWATRICNHPEHDPPSHICIPQGKKMVHTCPKCGRTTETRAPVVTLSI